MSKAKPSPLVLVVDDYDDGRELYAEYLSHFGYRVATAGTGVEALAQTYSLSPDLILMDLSLPGMDGWEATQRIRRDTRSKHIPIVAVSGHIDAGAEARARQAGCDSFILKPCVPDEVLREIRRLLQTSGRRGPRPSGASRPRGR